MSQTTLARPCRQPRPSARKKEHSNRLAEFRRAYAHLPAGEERNAAFDRWFPLQNRILFSAEHEKGGTCMEGSKAEGYTLQSFIKRLCRLIWDGRILIKVYQDGKKPRVAAIVDSGLDARDTNDVKYL
jgi:hypothetical protein